MAHLSLYRKWRPQRFEDVVGQEAVVRTLRNALRLHRFAHAYLFSGPRGTGKTTLARLVSKGLNCQQGPTDEPCGSCPPCRRIGEGRSLDVIEIDGASNRGIDEVRELRENARFAPAESRFKVYIIDEVHMLTHEAFNALLKLLEEPPAHVIFIFATTEPHRLPATIISRCQRFDLHRLSEPELEGRLREVAAKEGIPLEDEALRMVARLSQGALRDGLSLLDQLASLGEEGSIGADLVRDLLGLVPEDRVDGLLEALAAADAGKVLEWLARLEGEGVDFRQLARATIERVRDLLVILTVPDPGDLVYLEGERLTRSQELARRLGWERLEAVARAFGAAEAELRRGESPRLTLELTCLEVLRAASLEERIRRLEARLEGNGLVSAPPSERTAPAGQGVREGQAAPRRTAPPPSGRAEGPAGKDEPAPPRGPTPAPESERSSDEARDQDDAGTDLGRLWDGVLAELSRSAAGRATHAFAREARLARVGPEEALLVYPHGYAFHYSNLSQKVHRERVQRLLGRQLGRPIVLRIALEEEGGAEPVRAHGRPEKGGRTAAPAGTVEAAGDPGAGRAVEADQVQDPVVRKALEFFGGHVVRIEPKD